MKQFCWLIVVVSLLFNRGRMTAAQETVALTLTRAATTVALNVPAAWLTQEADLPRQIEARSAESFYVGGTDFQRVVLQLDSPSNLAYGALPGDDGVGTLLELIAATLPITGDFKPQSTSEIVRFMWDDYRAALFQAYTPADEALPAYYAQWFGIEISRELILVIQLGTTLPPNLPPTSATQGIFAVIRESLQINGDPLDPSGVNGALSRVSDPLQAIAPAVAALRLPNGTEIRLAAPDGWTRRDVTTRAVYPTNYLFEDDLRELPEGANPIGAVVQVSLLDQALFTAQVGELPAVGSIAQTYVTALTSNSAAGLVVGEPVDFQWGDFPAVILTTHYPAEIALHSGGTYQQLIAVEVDERLLILTIYTPELRWIALAPVWQNMLGSLLINGAILPADGLIAALEAVE